MEFVSRVLKTSLSMTTLPRLKFHFHNVLNCSTHDKIGAHLYTFAQERGNDFLSAEQAPPLPSSFLSFPHFPFASPSRPHPLEVGPLFDTRSSPFLPFSRFPFYLLYHAPSLPLEIGS